MKNFAESASSSKAKRQPIWIALKVILRDRHFTAVIWWLSAFVAVPSAHSSATTPAFNFEHDTFAFANQTVFEYREGQAYLRKKSDQQKRYNRHCFVLCRTAIQFYKFARFDPQSAPLDDKALAVRIRSVSRQQAWAPPLPEDQRVVFPGHANLREMSESRGKLLRDNIGLGWTVYLRLSNSRIVLLQDRGYQKETHAKLNESLAGEQPFVAYLSTFPRITVNHAILVYKRKSLSRDGTERYAAYDPNHPEAPRELTWFGKTSSFAYQKDVDFVGGFVRVYQVYGKWLQ
jgi:hypothetical protein